MYEFPYSSPHRVMECSSEWRIFVILRKDHVEWSEGDQANEASAVLVNGIFALAPVTTLHVYQAKIMSRFVLDGGEVLTDEQQAAVKQLVRLWESLPSAKFVAEAKAHIAANHPIPTAGQVEAAVDRAGADGSHPGLYPWNADFEMLRFDSYHDMGR